jgi:PEGA domain
MPTFRPYAVMAFLLAVPSVACGQAAVEYGHLAAGSAGAISSAKPTLPGTNLPGNASGSGSGTSSRSASNSSSSPETIAKSNRQFFQTHSGPNAAQISVHTIPVNTAVWIDGKFVGSTPLDLKLTPGHHQVLVRSPNMQQSVKEFDLTPKQVLPVEFTLKSAYPSQMILQWPSHQ